MVGAGAVGSYYGARLAEAGHDVHFVLRREFERVRERGLIVKSVDGDLTLADPTVLQPGDTPDGGPMDWVLCALKATPQGLAAARELCQPFVRPVHEPHGGVCVCSVLLMPHRSDGGRVFLPS